MKEGWIVKKLGDICEIKSGKSISATCIKETKSSSMFECYGGNGIRGYVETYRFDGVFPIIGRVGALCGNVHLACGKFNATEHALVVNIKSKDINPYWLVYNLKSMNLRNIAKGVAQPVISAGEVVKINIFVPDFEEQTKIVEELDQLSNIIEKQRQQLSELDNLAQSIFYDMFGDPVTNEKGFPMYCVDDIIDFQGGSQPDKKYFEYSPTSDNIRLIQIRDYKSDKNITYIPKEKARRFCDVDDIMIGRYGPPIFQILRGLKGAYNVALMKAVPKQGEKEFIRAFLKQEKLLHYLENFARRVAGQDGIQMDKLKAYPFPLPPLSLQQLFAQKIEAIEQEKEIIKQSIAETEELFNSRMDYYFG